MPSSEDDLMSISYELKGHLVLLTKEVQNYIKENSVLRAGGTEPLANLASDVMTEERMIDRYTGKQAEGRETHDS